ncbi:tRNA 5-methoxyuridine(34)/uridine 5-oxyacetic acid(34) synthase CmoB [Deltaproteobacteria bacterium TL4]
MNMDYLQPYARKLNLEEIQKVRYERQSWLTRQSNQTFAQTLKSQPPLKTRHLVLDQNIVEIGHTEELNPEQSEHIREALKIFIPWRKGPFNIFGTSIEAEWESYLKWDRLTPVAKNLRGLTVADIGCNNGYYMFRMAAQKPRLVIGFDPTARYWYTFHYLQQFAQLSELHFELLGMEHLSFFPSFFDVVFCLGVVYHHPDPIGMLRGIFSSLKPGGQLILESQGIPGEDSIALFPEKRYAKVPGTWFIPTATCLLNWVHRSGFRQVELFYAHALTSAEQRSTKWAPFQSLSDFLNPSDSRLTVEGYPAPMRFYVKACRPLP